MFEILLKCYDNEFILMKHLDDIMNILEVIWKNKLKRLARNDTTSGLEQLINGI